MPMAVQTIDLEATQTRIRAVFPRPQILAKIMQADSAAALEQCLRYEPGFTRKLLTLANSPCYQAPERLTTLRAAAAFLGTNLVKSIAIHASVMEVFNFSSPCSGFPEELRRHSAAVGVCAKMISRRLKLGSAEDFFLLGILHDVGLVIEHQFYREPFLAMLARFSRGPYPLLPQAEREIFGLDHTVFSRIFCDQWELPPAFGQIVRYHHDPLAAPRAIQLQACALYLANEIALARQFSLHPPAAGGPDPGALARLRLGAGDLDVLAEDHEQEIQVLDQTPEEGGVRRG